MSSEDEEEAVQQERDAMARPDVEPVEDEDEDLEAEDEEEEEDRESDKIEEREDEQGSKNA